MIPTQAYKPSKTSIALVIFCAIILLICGVFAEDATEPSVQIYDPDIVHVFHSPYCAECHKVLPFIEEYEILHPEVPVQYHDITRDQEDILLFEHFRKMHPDEKIYVPVIFIGNHILVGEKKILSDLEDTIQTVQQTVTSENGFGLPDSSGEISINPVILLLAAIGEGFNPCGLLVLALLLVSLMASDSRKTILYVGSAFIIAFFIVRVLSGFAIFSVIQLPGVAHYFLIAAGVIAIIAGIFQIKDGLQKKKQALFSIPRSKKGSISKYLKMASIPAGFIVGGLTGLYGMACTVGIYISVLGMIYQDFETGVLYLLAYNLVVIIPLIAILLLVLFGLSPEKLNAWRDERKSHLRITIGVIMLLMGIIILVPIFI